jgi:predicted dehydrogenase
MKIRWGILGAARINRALIPAIQQSAQGELVGIAARDETRARDQAAQYHIPRVFADYDALLASPDIDAVYNPLPNGLHAEWTIRALNAGKHVLCEKPFAANLLEVDAMIAAAQKNDRRLMEAFMWRFHPQVVQAKRLLDDGAIGSLKLIRVTFHFFLDRPYDIRIDPNLAGGALMDVGCYGVNASRLFAGTEPLAVSAMQDVGPSGVDESFTALLEFPNGVLATIDCGFRAHFNQLVVVSGTDGRIEILAPFLPGAERDSVVVWQRGEQTDVIKIAATNHYLIMVNHFNDCIQTSRMPDYSLDNARGQMRTIDALYESARTGARVRV